MLLFQFSLCQRNRFYGTHQILYFDSFVIHYIVADDVSPSGKAVFQYNLQGYKQLGFVSDNSSLAIAKMFIDMTKSFGLFSK